jgi:protein CpxP
MKTLSIALATLPLLAVGAALAQTPVVLEDEDLLTPQERNLARNPYLHPEWTWMRESQAIILLKTIGFSDVIRLEKNGSFWRAVAIKDHATYHVVIDRYTGLVAHMDKKSRASKMLSNGPIEATISTVMKPGKMLPTLKSRESYAVAPQTQGDAAIASKTMQATLNGPVAVPIRQKAPTVLTPGKPTLTVMGEVGWTWMKESHAKRMLKAKGYANIVSLKRDAQGIWRGEALRDGLALNVGIDMYGNVETQPENSGGAAQASSSY